MSLPLPAGLLPPDTICGYTVLRSPSPGNFTALADGGRTVLLKPLDIDCLLHAQLHPSIKERLSRVRELALKSAANLHGVERDKHGVFLVWEYIDGENLDAHTRSLPAPQFISMMREVILIVEALHQVGIVHGALHARNVIVDAGGRPRLTHISPLLFHDPAVDQAAVSSMLASLIEHRSDIEASLRAGLLQRRSLRDLSTMLVTPGTLPSQSRAHDAQDRRRRRQMLIFATATMLLGAIIAITIVAIANNH